MFNISLGIGLKSKNIDGKWKILSETAWFCMEGEH